jgi:hypothetical protein
MLKPLDVHAEDSLSFSIWPSLATRSGLEFIVLALIEIAETDSTRQDSVTWAIITLYKTSPEEILDFLVRHLSFMFWLNHFVHTPVDISSVLPDILPAEDMESSGKADTPLSVFLLKILASIAEKNVSEILGHLPVIFSACLQHYELLKPLMIRILLSIELQFGTEAPPMVHDLTRIDYKDKSEVSFRLFQLLLDLDQDLAALFGLEILRWGTCCGNIQRAKIAIEAFKGFIYPSTNVVVGLFSRCFWILSESLCEVTMENPEFDYSNYIDYFVEMMRVLLGIAGSQLENNMLGANSSIFWIACEALKCNKQRQTKLFEAAMEVVLFHIAIPNLFLAVENQSGQILPGQFSSRVFRKFHQPWREPFLGLGSLICTYEGTHIEVCIRALNLIVQSRFFRLFNPKDNAVYTIFLLLMPWIWKIVMTDLSRFIFTSSDAQLLEGTLDIFRAFLVEEEIQVGLDAVREAQETEFYDSVKDLFRVALTRVDQDDLQLIATFYTSMLRHGDKNLKIPLYSLATILIDQIPETATNLLSFAELVKEDVKNRRIQLQATFLERIPSAVEPVPKAPVAPFPFLKLTERIVVVDVPHLYEVDALSERASLCEDINGFIPICPIDPIFLKVEKVRVIREMLEKVDIPPFQRWS